MKKVFFVVALGTLAACGGTAEGEQASGQAAVDAPVVEVSAADISAAFQENEVKAKMEYGGKTLQVSGTIKDIELDFMDNPVVKVKGANDTHDMGVSEAGKMTDLSLSGLPKDVAAGLKKGDKITVRCTKIDEAMGGAMLGGCSTVS